jgi:aspartate carbamoyltransferase catalytic subunit
MDDPREHGTQPFDALMQKWELTNHELVEASPEQLNHKQVQKARKGRQLTLVSMQKVCRSMNIAIWNRLNKEQKETYFEYMHRHLFNYAKGYDPEFVDPNVELFPKRQS